MHKSRHTDLIMLIASMVIFGTVGLFRRSIPWPSGLIATCRGFVGMLFLLGVMAARRQKPDWSAIRRRLPLLLLSGAALGLNWMLLFEAYQHTSVATATLCYYMAPVMVLLLSPLLLREKLTARKLLCIAAALAGMVLSSGVLDAGFSGKKEWLGVLLGLGAAAFYTMVMLCNKRLTDLPAFDRTFVQLGVAALALIPYDMLTADGASLALSANGIVMLAIVCIVHTGLAYALYFGAMKGLRASTVALYSYIDPIVAILCSALILRESIGLTGYVGAVLVIGAMILSERGQETSSEA